MSKSLKTNGVLNMMRIVSTLLMPLISFPYISRVLEVENLGISNFVQSISSYFLLISALGVTNYAIREGSRLLHTAGIEEFVSEVFSINVISTLISYVLLFLTLLLFPRLQEYQVFIIIYSVTLFFNTLGVEWIFSVYEDYYYLTVRTIVIQIISLVALFLFVRSQNDLMMYMVILTVGKSLPSLWNLGYIGKYVKLKFTFKLNLKKHLKPILLIFATTIATTIYVNSDITMLGLIDSNTSVGLYTTSVKIYTILKTILSAFIVVSLPRISSYLATNNKQAYESTLSKLLNSLIVFTFPMSVGLIIVAEGVILMFAGTSYLSATLSLRILSFALMFSTLGSFYATSILLPLRQEKIILIASIVSASINVGLNLVFIPLLSLNGAALTTLVSEIVMVLVMILFNQKAINLSQTQLNTQQSFIGVIWIVISFILLQQFSTNLITLALFSAMIGGIGYMIVLYRLRNPIVIEMIQMLHTMMKQVFQKSKSTKGEHE